MKYIVVEAGIEYNDSTYDINSIAGVVPKLFDSKVEAIQYAENSILDRIGNYRLGEVDQYNSGYEGYRMRESGDEFFDRWPPPTYREAVEHLKSKGQPWRSILPDIFSVFEVDENL